MLMTFSRYQRSRRKPPARASRSRSVLLAAMIRAPVLIGALPPTGVSSRSCSTRSSFTWKAGLVSLISSRNTVPSPACSNRPRRLAIAPVNEPRRCPNSSDSSSVSVSAPQFTATKGSPCRTPWR